MWVSVPLLLLCHLYFCIAFTCSNHLYLEEVDVVFRLSQLLEHGALPLEGSDLLLHLFDQTLSSALCCSKTRLHHLEARANTESVCSATSLWVRASVVWCFTSKNLPWQCSTLEMSLEKAQTASSVSFSATVWCNKREQEVTFKNRLVSVFLWLFLSRLK